MDLLERREYIPLNLGIVSGMTAYYNYLCNYDKETQRMREITWQMI